MISTASKLEVLAANEAQGWSRWNELVDQAPNADVYYRPGYAYASQAAGHGRAVGLVIAAHRVSVLVPLLLRPLSDLSFAEGDSGFDAISPYGYGGMLPLPEAEPLAEADVPILLHSLREWCRDEGVVSCLIRMHPLLHQDRWFAQNHLTPDTTVLHYRAQTLALDLAKWDSARQRIAGMRRDRREGLNRARRYLRLSWSGVDVPLGEALAHFREIYEQRMRRLGAESFYFFPCEYYTALQENLERHMGVALAWRDRQLVGASVFLADRRFAHHHLSGSDDEGRDLEAGALLLNAGAHWARDRGCQLLHMGGGGIDGLVDYKKSFGGDTYHYHTLELIADEPHYRELVERRVKFSPASELRQGFFPQYRA